MVSPLLHITHPYPMDECRSTTPCGAGPLTRSARVSVMATMRCGSLLVDCAGRSVERERRGHRVGDAVPGAVEAEAGVSSAGGNVFPCLAGLFAHLDVGATLRYGSIPRTADGLSVGKGPGQRPVAQSGGSVVDDAKGRSELARVLRRNRVVHPARGAGPRGTHGE